MTVLTHIVHIMCAVPSESCRPRPDKWPGMRRKRSPWSPLPSRRPCLVVVPITCPCRHPGLLPPALLEPRDWKVCQCWGIFPPLSYKQSNINSFCTRCHSAVSPRYHTAPHKACPRAPPPPSLYHRLPRSTRVHRHARCPLREHTNMKYPYRA